MQLPHVLLQQPVQQVTIEAGHAGARVCSYPSNACEYTACSRDKDLGIRQAHEALDYTCAPIQVTCSLLQHVAPIERSL